MCLEQTEISAMLSTSNFAKDILAVIIDEAHCISQWGAKFRKKYGELGRLRFFVHLQVPVMAVSATMPPLVLEEVRMKLHFEWRTTFLLNLGNNRPNITLLVRKMNGAASDLKSLDFAVDEESVTRTMIFFNERLLAQSGSEHLRNIMPTVQRGRVDFDHAGRSQRSEQIVMKAYRSGIINVLCATEAFGMVRASLHAKI